jgi:hypothetical protein
VLAIAVMLAAILACAKNPFSTRNSEPPLGAGGTWDTPQSPDVTVKNLLFAYNEKVISNFELCLSDSFLFSAAEDSIDAVNNGRGDLFADWNRTVEFGTATLIFRNYSNSDTMNLYLTMVRSSDHEDDTGDSTATLYREYTLLIIRTSTGESDSTTATGTATFHLIQEKLNWWTILWWEDQPSGAGIYSWGDFKAEYRR